MLPAAKIILALFLTLNILLSFQTITQAQGINSDERVTVCGDRRKTMTELTNELQVANPGVTYNDLQALITAYQNAACPGYSTQNSTPTPEPITAQNYKANEHSAFTWKTEFESLGCMLIGKQMVQDSEKAKKTKCPADLDGKLVAYDRIPNGGALGGLNTVMVALYSTPPTSTTQYLADLGTNLGIMRPAYAQNVTGSGDGVIRPILEVWRVMRNISYLVFTLIFLVVGLMIMFRQKINPQTVITAQAALPGLVIGLILVTFSYFISALIVDLSFVSMQLVAAIFNPVKNVIDPQQTANNSNIFGLFGSFIWNSAPFSEVPPKISALFSSATNALQIDLGGIGNVLFGSIIGTAVGLLVSLVIIIALLIQMFKLIWQLVSAYITILAVTILSPLIILASALPGKGGILGLWWKTLLANVLIFPAVFLVFLLAGVILKGADDNFKNTLPLFATIDPKILKVIIGYGIVLGTPAIPKMVKDALGVKDIQGIPQAASAGALAGLGLGRAAGEKFVDRYSRERSAVRDASTKGRMSQYVNAQTGQLAPQTPWYARWFNR